MKRLIIPSEKKHPKTIKQISKLSPELAKPPFFIIIQGAVGAGKSSLLYSLLVAYQETNFFDIIFFYNRVSDSNKAWLSFDNDKKTAVEIRQKYNNKELLEIINNINDVQKKRREDKKRPLNILFVFDDMIYSNISSSKKSNALDELVINRRHLGVSLIITSQTYRSLNQNLRTNNLSQLILVRANTKDLKNISEEHNLGLVSENKIIEMYKDIKKKDKYGFLMIDYSDTQNRTFKDGFETVIEF